MSAMRDLVIGTAPFVLLVVAGAVPSWSAAQVQVAGAAPAAAAARISPITSGPGFALCAADETWRRPTTGEQRAHLTGDHRFDGAWETADTAGYQEFRAPAVLYDGTSASGLSWIVHFPGLWTVCADAARHPTTRS